VAEGVIPDANEAVASPQGLTEDPDRARRLLDLVGSVPRLVWGRDEMRTGEMWNSNSVISWLIARSGIATDLIRPPTGGRAPGWEAGLIMAGRQQRVDEGAAHSRRFTSIRRPRRQWPHGDWPRELSGLHRMPRRGRVSLADLDDDARRNGVKVGTVGLTDGDELRGEQR
jgi:hypothetical protein